MSQVISNKSETCQQQRTVFKLVIELLKRAYFGIILMAYRKRIVTIEARLFLYMDYRTRNNAFEACFF